MSIVDAQPNFTSAVYTQMVANIKQQCGIAAPDFYFFGTPTYFATPEMFAARTEQVYAENTYKVKFLMLRYGNFRDSKSKGWDEIPDTSPTFILSIFHQFKESHQTPDKMAWLPNSHDITVGRMIDIRNQMLLNRDVIEGELVRKPIEQIGDMAVATPCPYVANDCIGDLINFRITWEIE